MQFLLFINIYCFYSFQCKSDKSDTSDIPMLHKVKNGSILILHILYNQGSMFMKYNLL